MTYTLASKEEILAHVAAEDYSWFEEGEFLQGKATLIPKYGSKAYSAFEKRRAADQLTPEETAEIEISQIVDPVEDWNLGDGHDAFKTYHFPQYNLYVSLTGWYSSHGAGEWTEIFVSEPYQHTETRYRKIPTE